MLSSLNISGAVIVCRRCERPYLLPRRRGLLPSCPNCLASPRPLLRDNGLAAVVAVIALGMLSLGMCRPFISMIKLGDVRTFSLPGGIAELYRDGEQFLAVVLATFSVIFPFVKLIGLLLATTTLIPFSAKARRRLHKGAVLTGKYSMLDVFVVAVSIILVKFQAIAEVHAQDGTYLFCAAVGLSMLSGLCVDSSRFSDDLKR